MTDKFALTLTTNKKQVEEQNDLRKYSFLQKVNENQSRYTKRQIQSEEKARQYQLYLTWPSTQHLKEIVSKNLLNNCEITVDDVHRAEDIFGTPLPLLKGKMCRRSPIRHPQSTKLRLPMIF